jgi:hypothetical protein
MKKLTVVLIAFLFSLSLPMAQAENSIIRITAPKHQLFSGEFRNDDLVQKITPSGDLGLLVFRPAVKNRTWVIDAALVDEVIAMSGDYTLANDAEPIGTQFAIDWIAQLKRVTENNDVVALAYGNPDTALARRLAPSELKKYISFGKERLELALGRPVRSDTTSSWSTGKSKINNDLRRNYTENRQALTALSRVVDEPEVLLLRVQLAQLLSATLNKDDRQFFSYNARNNVNLMINKLRINSGKYQITTSSVELPVTVINEFDVPVKVDVLMLPINGRVVVDSFDDVVIAAKSKVQLAMQVDVIAPGETVVLARLTDNDGEEVVPDALLTLNSTVIDTKVTWFTTGAAIILLLAAITQSVRRVRRRVK